MEYQQGHNTRTPNWGLAKIIHQQLQTYNSTSTATNNLVRKAAAA